MGMFGTLCDIISKLDNLSRKDDMFRTTEKQSTNYFSQLLKSALQTAFIQK